MRYFSKEQQEQVVETLKEFKDDARKTAIFLGLTPKEVSWIDIVANKKFNYTEEGRGKKELQPYIVAIRNRLDEPAWDNMNSRIVKARELYDAGVVEIIHGNDGVNIIMYAMPRRYPDMSRKPYFVAIDEDEYEPISN